MMAEAKLLRQHKGRLEARMQILEDHNRQLEAQLQRLRQLLDEPNNGGVGGPGSALNSKPNTLQTRSVTASQLNTDSPAKINQQNGHYDQNTSKQQFFKWNSSKIYFRSYEGLPKIYFLNNCTCSDNCFSV